MTDAERIELTENIRQLLLDGNSIGTVARALGKSYEYIRAWVTSTGIDYPKQGRRIDLDQLLLEYRLFVQGKTISEIARELGMSVNTVSDHVKKIRAICQRMETQCDMNKLAMEFRLPIGFLKQMEKTT